MPYANPADLQRILELSDNRFFDLLNRIDKSHKGAKPPTPPDTPAQKKTRTVHAGMAFERERQYLIDQAMKGVI